MLDDVEHELVIQQPDQVKTAETGCAAKREIPGDDIVDDKNDVTKTTST